MNRMCHILLTGIYNSMYMVANLIVILIKLKLHIFYNSAFVFIYADTEQMITLSHTLLGSF